MNSIISSDDTKIRIQKNGIGNLVLFLTILFPLQAGLVFIDVPVLRVLLFGLICIVAYFFLILSDALYGDFFSPIGLMGSFWMGSLGLYILQLAPSLQPDLRLVTIVALFGSLISFIFGCLAVSKYAPIDKLRPLNTSFNSSYEKKVLEYAILSLFILGLSAFIIQLTSVLIDNSLSLFLQNPGKAQKEFWMFGVGYLHLLNSVVVVLSSSYLARYGVSSRYLLILASSLLFLPFHLLKAVVILTIFAATLAVYYTIDRHVGLQYGILTLASVLSFFVLYSTATGQVNNYISQGVLHLPKWASALSRPYLYASTEFANVQAALLSDVSYSGGVRTFRALLKILLIDIIFGLDLNSFNEMRYVYYEGQIEYGIVYFNANTYLGYFYYDFGWPGILLGSFVTGLVSGSFYIYHRLTHSIISTSMYSIIAYCTAFAFFYNAYSRLYIWIFIGSLAIIQLIYNSEVIRQK